MTMRKKTEFLVVCAFALCGMVVTVLTSFADTGRFAPTNSMYEIANGLTARVASDLAGLDERWHRNRSNITVHRDTSKLASGGEPVPSSPN